MKTRRQALLQALPILFFTLLFGVVIVLLAWRTAGGINRSQDVVTAYRPVFAVCEGRPLPGAPGYDGGDSQHHPVVVLRRAGKSWVPDTRLLPESWRPLQPTAAELVLCLEAELPLTAARCGAEDTAQARVYGYAMPVRLLAAATGEEVATSMLNSAPALACWEVEPVALPVADEVIQSWLAGFVNRPAPE